MNLKSNLTPNIKVNIFLILLIGLGAFANQAFAQKKEFVMNIPYNEKWEISEQTLASYYRQGRLVFDKVSYFAGVIRDKYKSGSLQMTGTYDETGLKQGPFKYYYEDGKLEREGNFEKDDMLGLWSFFNKEGDLILKINCKTNRDFTILFYKDKGGNTLIKDGNGKFIIDLEEYPDLMWNISQTPVKYMQGTMVGGIRDGEWNYYSTLNSTSSVVYKGNRLTFTDLYKTGKFRYGNSFLPIDVNGRYRKPRPLLTVYPMKDAMISQFAGDFAFGGGQEAGRNLFQFFFDNLKPTITSTSLFYKNNNRDYIKCIEAALSLTTDYKITETPDVDFEEDSWVMLNELSLLQQNDIIPPSGKTDISFNVMNNGELRNINVKSDLPANFVQALKYYLSILKKLSPAVKQDSALVNLTFSLDNQIGYKDSQKSLVTYGVIYTKAPEFGYQKYMVKDSLIITSVPPVFSAGPAKWNEYLEEEMKKIAKIVPEDYLSNIILNFTVDENGNLIDIMGNPGNDYDTQLFELTKRILRRSPKWNPATLDGKRVKSKQIQLFQYY
jgi:antitoxin component YwqK of YwqJK toxin-antitoxin module